MRSQIWVAAAGWVSVLTSHPDGLAAVTDHVHGETLVHQSGLDDVGESLFVLDQKQALPLSFRHPS